MIQHVSAIGFSVAYRGKKTPAIDNLSVGFGDGVTSVVGPNGSGKSTLFRSFVTLQRRYDGQLSVLGYDLHDSSSLLEVRRRIGYLPQDFDFTPSFTVHEFVSYVAWLKRVSNPANAINEAIAAVGLAEQRDVRLGRLSGGMRRRAGIAQAIVNSPELLLLDEPTAGLDPEQRINFRQLIRDLGTVRGVITSTHLIEDVRAASNHVVVLSLGRLAFNGSVDDLELRGREGSVGDTPLERAYTEVLKNGSGADL